MTELIRPHGGTLVDLLADAPRARSLRQDARSLPTWTLTERQLCDLELLLSGGFSPLTGFLGRSDYETVLHHLRLADGTLWPIPVTLHVTPEVADAAERVGKLLLRGAHGVMLAVLTVEDVWRPDRLSEAAAVFGTERVEHPGVAQLLHDSGPVNLGGRIEGIQEPPHFDYPELRRTPAQLRAVFQQRGWTRVVAFQTRNPMHRAHYEMTVRAAAETGAKLLIHPVVGTTRAGDIDHYTRVRCYQALLPRYADGAAVLSLLPLGMRMAGPREALWHAIIRKNFGCTHFIVGRDHAGPGADSTGRPFYGPYDAQELLERFVSEVGVTPVRFREMVYLESEQRYVPEGEASASQRVLKLSGTELRQRLAGDRPIPEWFTFPDVARELRGDGRLSRGDGLTVFFTGLPAAGKSTLANALIAKLRETGERRDITLLDGDVVRERLSADLGFSKEDRNTNIRRIGAAAAEVTRSGGIAVCAAIAPYDRVRKEVRAMVESFGRFVLVHVATPLAVCEARDPKGLYAKARAGEIADLTGVSDPYEDPEDAELVIDTTAVGPTGAAERVIGSVFRAQGYDRQLTSQKR